MEAIQGVSRWHRWAVSGTGCMLSQVLRLLDVNLPAGWKRLSGDDLLKFQTLVRAESAWYAIDTTTSHAGVILSLERLGESQLRGGRVWLAEHPHLTSTSGVSSAWDQVMRFLDEGVVPAAQGAGVQVRIPTPEEVFLADLPTDVRDCLRAFSRAARKSFPLTREEADLWRGFVIAAFRTEAVIDAEQFIGWLVTDGWSRESASELSVRFYDQCILLSRYADEVSAA